MLESKINSNSYHQLWNCFARFSPLVDEFIRCTLSNVKNLLNFFINQYFPIRLLE